MAKLGTIGLKKLLQIIGDKLTGKADKDHTHDNYLTEHPSITTSSPANNSSTVSWGDQVTAYSEISKDSNGHVTGGKITKYTLPSSEATASAKGLMSAADKKAINELPDVYAKKSDIVNVYHYKGSVDIYSNLPGEDLNSGDVYNVEDTGKNYAWTGSAWDDLGGSFEFEEEEITEEEVERICNEVWGA